MPSHPNNSELEAPTALFPAHLDVEQSEIHSLSEWQNADHGRFPGLRMGQAWAGAEGGERGTVRLALTETHLYVHAEMPDRDIFNPVHTFNEAAWNKGDVFEMFLRPEGQQTYYEFHVNPNNTRYQLRLYFPRPGHRENDHPDIAVESEVTIEPTKQQWKVYARIPLAELVEPANTNPAGRWHVSFCRYDYTRSEGKTLAELFSTSPHREISFHRSQEWIPLRRVAMSRTGAV